MMNNLMKYTQTSYKQFRIAKRNGEIIQQQRTVVVVCLHQHPFWKFWKWGIYESTYNYCEWKDIPIVNVEDEQ